MFWRWGNKKEEGELPETLSYASPQTSETPLTSTSCHAQVESEVSLTIMEHPGNQGGVRDNVCSLSDQVWKWMPRKGDSILATAVFLQKSSHSYKEVWSILE